MINNLIELASDYIIHLTTTMGPLFGVFIIILESIIPILPLALFIGLNTHAFGFVFGYLISYLATCAGSLLSFFLFRKIFYGLFTKRINERPNIVRLAEKMGKIKLHHLVILMSLPFTPAFAINIAGGISKIKYKKFIIALLLGKPAMVYFWGYVGHNFIDLLSNPMDMLKITVALLIAYIVSKAVSHYLKLD